MKIASQLLIVAVFLGLSISVVSTAFANDNAKWPVINGQVVAVDTEQSVVIVKNDAEQQMTFQVVPTSEITIKSKGLLKFNRNATLKDLTAGQRVSVTYYGSGELKVARDIKSFFGERAVNTSP
ncbi:hypothetical protein [Halodesulfovibrio aestuarii]|uniref:hypothetical protein n=1 Tax=Halodesulfovibrio aestuarii TaxID=126333 RepID=UPI000481E76C